MIRANLSNEYTLDQLRNAEDFLSRIDEICYSLVKLRREYSALITSSGPKGYVCQSVECGPHKSTCGISAELLTQRISELSSRYQQLYDLLCLLKQDLKKISKTKEFMLLYLRFKKGLNAAETTARMNSSVRNYYRIRQRALYPVCESLLKTELGRKVLQNGSSAVLHRYFR